MPALLRPAHAGDDAIRAELVAANHDADVRLKRRRSHRWIAQRVVALEAALDLVARRFLAVETEGQLQLAGALHFLNQFGQTGKLAGAADDVHVRGTLADQFLVFLGHAAEHANNFLWVAALVGTEPAKRTVNLVLGVLADAASVEEDHVGRGR